MKFFLLVVLIACVAYTVLASEEVESSGAEPAKKDSSESNESKSNEKTESVTTGTDDELLNKVKREDTAVEGSGQQSDSVSSESTSDSVEGSGANFF